VRYVKLIQKDEVLTLFLASSGRILKEILQTQI